ncbi:hypothetical protein [Actinacidiphila guanduensis]|jgi:hypothetical protein|uniref:Uncharacterized protein n=1 Tax=Actinacidiphila guanduensis TaxID=310781 RepID=A0A1H0NC41_9ACTN|nr:hypothetical protein [Actinacidiphila guanduensis]SDO90213.1 hypothetical protein SAMN05216259_11413 [Actinacidiphila guanduensis]
MNAMSTQQATRPDARAEQPAEPPRPFATPSHALGLRFSAMLAAVFFVLSGLLAWGAAETDLDDIRNVVAVMSSVCFVAFLAALIHAARMAARLRHPAPRHRAA